VIVSAVGVTVAPSRRAAAALTRRAPAVDPIHSGAGAVSPATAAASSSGGTCAATSSTSQRVRPCSIARRSRGSVGSGGSPLAASLRRTALTKPASLGPKRPRTAATASSTAAWAGTRRNRIWWAATSSAARTGGRALRRSAWAASARSRRSWWRSVP
jgi:hypothetical protein